MTFQEWWATSSNIFLPFYKKGLSIYDVKGVAEDIWNISSENTVQELQNVFHLIRRRQSSGGIMTYSTLPTIYCQKCGLALIYSWNRDNMCYIASHHPEISERNKIICESAQEILKAPEIKLERV